MCADCKRDGRDVPVILVDARNPNAKKAYFINGNYEVSGETPSYAKYHYDFAKKQLGITEGGGEFNDVTYFADDKRYYAGSRSPSSTSRTSFGTTTCARR